MRIFVRTDVDYAQMSRRTFAAQRDPTRPLVFIRGVAQAGSLEVFEREFRTDFFAFREQLRAEADLARSELDGVRQSVGVSDIESWLSSSEEELIVPSDDDDLFHPDLPVLIRPADTVDIVVWRWTGLGVHAWDTAAGWHTFDEPLLASNNWAVRKSFLRDSLSRRDAIRFLTDHAAAHEIMQLRFGVPFIEAPVTPWGRWTPLRHPSVCFIDGSYSIQYLHPGSLAFLLLSSQATELCEHLRALRLELPPPPSGLTWAEPWVRRHQALLDRLQEGRSGRVSEPRGSDAG